MQKDLRNLMRDPNLLPSEKLELLMGVASQAALMHVACYLVGGFVRDLLLEKPVNDFDLVLEGDAIKLGHDLVKKYGGELIAHKKFGTAVWLLDENTSLDLISARSETYESPGALPSVKPSTIQDDLRRRDFTLNAIAARLDGDHVGELMDPLNGQGDLEEGQLRLLHARSFIDDPTRILRAIRYEQRYGFKIEPDTLKMIDRDALAVLSKLSGERIRSELDLFLDEENSARMLLRAEELGILSVFQPELPNLNGQYVDLVNSRPPENFGISYNRGLLGYLLWVGDCNSEILSQISRRLDFTSELTKMSLALIQLKRDLTSLKGSRPSVWADRLDAVSEMAIYALWLMTGEAGLKEYLTNWRHVHANITGDDLKARGLPPGPRYGEILSRLRAAWLDGEVKNHDEAMDLLRKLL